MRPILLIIVLCFLHQAACALELDVTCKDPHIEKDAVAFFSENITQNNLKHSISHAIKRFYYRWSIENIFVHYEEADRVSIRIIPDFSISDVKVRGNRQVKKSEIIKQVRVFETVYQGVEIQQELEKFIKDYYAYRGFLHAQVRSEFVKHNRSGSLKVMLHVKENQACHVDRVKWRVVGDENRKKIAHKLKKKIKHRCDQELLENAVKGIEEKYRDQLYRQVDVASHGFSQPVAQDVVDLEIQMQLGKRIDVQFFGNTFAFERDELLKKEIFLEQEKKFNQVWVEVTAKESIIGFYHAKGYPFVQVEVAQDEDIEQNIDTIKFMITRGPLMRINNISFQGNQKVSGKKLRSQFYFYAPEATRRNIFVKGEVDTVVDRLISFYQSNGFLRASILEPSITFDKKNHAVDIMISVQEGGRTVFEDLEVHGNTVFSKRQLEKVIRVKKGSGVNPIRLKEQAKALQRDYRERGYKYAQVVMPRIDELDKGRVIVSVHIDEGPQIIYGDIVFRGNFITQDWVIRREVKFAKGDSYNIIDVERTRTNLIQLGFFQSVTILGKPREDAPGIEDMVIVIRERKQRLLVLRPGVSTDDGYRFTSSFGYTNIMGTGRSATLSGRVNRQVQSANILEHRLIFTYLEPNILNFFDIKVSLISERTDEILFDISRNSLIVGLEKLWSRYFRTTVQWELEKRNPFNADAGVILSPIDETRARFGSVSAIIDVDFRDNVLNSERGTFHRFQFDYFDKTLLSDAEFYRVSLINNFYVPLYRRIRSIFSVRLGFADTLGATKAEGIDQIPIEKRFRLGGNDSLRGFSRNCVGGLASGEAENCSNAALSQAPGGNSLFNYMLEFLFPLNDAVDLALFTDGGDAYLSNGDFDMTNIRFTAGFGLRYNTFVGPFRIDYGVKLDRRTGESVGQLHFAVGQF